MAKPSARLLSGAVLLALGLPTGAAVVPIPVTNCADDGAPGTLRVLLASAFSGDTFDTSACSTITLTQGEIPIGANVAITGPDSGTTTIDANHGGRAFTSGGDLFIENLTVTGGRIGGLAQNDFGGCIAAKGHVTLIGSVVTDCQIDSIQYAGGGGVSGAAVTISDSRLEANGAYGVKGTYAYALGGAINALGDFRCVNSTISANKALADFRGEGGGVFVGGGSVYMLGCTVDNNTADFTAGVLQLNNSFGARPASPFGFDVINSTISGNSGIVADGSLYSQAPMLISNSTIAFNYAQDCGGIRNLQSSITLNSTIVARNREGPAGTCGEVFSASVSGSHNIVTHAVASVTLPADTLALDPQLTRLADHGGTTRTHALASSSPALEMGSNTTLLPGGVLLQTDQRGPFYARTVGATDIGAFERQVGDDEIYGDGFD